MIWCLGVGPVCEPTKATIKLQCNKIYDPMLNVQNKPGWDGKFKWVSAKLCGKNSPINPTVHTYSTVCEWSVTPRAKKKLTWLLWTQPHPTTPTRPRETDAQTFWQRTLKWPNEMSHWERFVQLPGARVLRMCVFVSVAELEMGGWGAEEDKTCSVSLVKDRRSPSTLASASYSCLHTAPLCPLVLRKPPSCLSQQHHCSLTLCMYPEYKQPLGRERCCVISVHFLFYLYFSLCDCVRACVCAAPLLPAGPLGVCERQW